jgi:ABC-type lipoprotein export system ATPase subunit
MSSRERAIYRRGGVGFVFQFYHLIPGLDALGNVELPLALAGVPRRERRRRAETLLERVGLRDRARHGPAELSGGEQQRVAIARALAHDPRRIFADEPTGNLDSRSAGEIMALLREVHAQGKTILLVTHDAALARAHASRIVTLSDGRVVEGEAA